MPRKVSAVVIAALIGGGLLGSGSAMAEYDNPTVSDVPCVVLSRYVSDRPTGTLQPGVPRSAEVAVENVCGRSVEVNLCIGYLEPVNGETASCVVETLRPWSASDVHRVSTEVPLTGPTWEWRWVSRDAGM